MKDIVFCVVSALLFIGIFVWSFYYVTDTPDVIFSHKTGKCVKVINADGSAGSCNNIPTSYNHYWGE